jgi:hypothetical protein
MSDTWNHNKLATTEARKNVCDIILSKVFWSLIEDCLRASARLLIVLRQLMLMRDQSCPKFQL